MGIGAVFAALNTMYSAVASRTREIATLRALGFGAGPVMISVLVESMLLALVGGAVGAAIAYLGFNGYQAATMNWQSMSPVAFAFRVTPALLVQGLAYALAARPARRPVPRHPGRAPAGGDRAARAVTDKRLTLRRSGPYDGWILVYGIRLSS